MTAKSDELNLHKRAINNLPIQQRRRVILKYFHGLSTQQISIIENVNRKTIEKSLGKAEKIIRKYVERFF